MAEGILTRPYMQVGELYAKPPRVVAMGAAAWVKVVDQDAKRLYFVVLPDADNNTPILSPVEFGTSATPIPGRPAVPTLVHGSVYPLLVTGQWFGWCSFACNVTIIEVIRDKSA